MWRLWPDYHKWDRGKHLKLRRCSECVKSMKSMHGEWYALAVSSELYSIWYALALDMDLRMMIHVAPGMHIHSGVYYIGFLIHIGIVMPWFRRRLGPDGPHGHNGPQVIGNYCLCTLVQATQTTLINVLLQYYALEERIRSSPGTLPMQ